MQHLLVVHRQNRQRVNSESNFLAEDFSNFESVKYFSIEENRSFEFTVVNLSFFLFGHFLSYTAKSQEYVRLYSKTNFNE